MSQQGGMLIIEYLMLQQASPGIFAPSASYKNCVVPSPSPTFPADVSMSIVF